MDTGLFSELKVVKGEEQRPTSVTPLPVHVGF